MQLIPFALVLAIFYFIILLPMKRKQQKVQEFLDSLKVGDRVVTTGGIYGQVTKVNEQTVQLQIADKVRIEVAKSAIGGYQGQEPVVDSASLTPCRICAGNSSPSSSSSSSSSAVGVYPILATRYGLPAPQWLRDRQLKLGLDLKGGVHLVLRVQTDDALRLETEPEMRAAARGAEDARRAGDASRFRMSTHVPGRGRAARRRTQAFRQAAEQEAGQLRPQHRAPTAATRSR